MFERYNPANWSIDWQSALTIGGEIFLAVLFAIIASYFAYRLIFGIVHRITHASETEMDEMIVEKLRRPVKWSFIAIGLTLVAQVNSDLQAIWEPLGKFLRPALLGWIAYTFVRAFTVALELRLDASDDPVAVRSRRTRIAVLSRTATVAILILTVGLMLFSIPSVQAIGTTMLASAGLAALAVGAAAQPALKSLIAGLQVALTEPLRIGDLVKVDGETGRVEEVRMSFITVRTWDERVLVVPTSRFLEQSFENWSRKSEKLTGPVFLHLDPATEIEPIRVEFESFVTAHALFDGRNHALMMTEAYPESIELRLSMSAPTIAELFQLRCDVREHMIGWLRVNMPDALIRHRLEVPNGHPKAGEP